MKKFNFLNKISKNIFVENKRNNNAYDNVYLDHAAATPVDGEVVKAMHEAESLYANPSGIYRMGVGAKNKIEESRKIISDILNCASQEIIFAGSGTESLNMGLIGYVENYLKENENKNAKSVPVKTSIPTIITSNIEHSAVLNPVLHLESKGLVKIKYLEVDETGRVDENHLREILKNSGSENKDNIILVSIMYANNETGRVQPVKEIGRIIDLHNAGISSSSAREARAGNERNNFKNKIAYHIDAMQAGNYLDLDIKKLRADMLSINGCKTYGPKGVGLLYKNKSINITPIILGGGQERGLRSGTEDVVKIVGLAHALKIAKEKRDIEIVRMLDLQNYFLEKVKKEIPEVKIYTYKNDVNKIINKKDSILKSWLDISLNKINKEDISDEKNIINNYKMSELDKSIKINYFNIESLPNNINIGLPNMLSDEMVIRLDYRGFCVSHKSACASNEIGEGSYVLRAMGASENDSNENIRITMGRATTKRDLEKLIENIKEIYYKYKSK